ncbi:MAG TPA: gamma-glutamylcyclotransferase family protein [Ilumatobacteraceae bacterium]
MIDAGCRLATYGSLAPGQANHHHLAGLDGRWLEGTVRGELHPAGWGAAIGFPGITLNEDGPAVPVHVFESADLVDHWARLDAFEGEEYHRVTAVVHTAGEDVDAYIYTLAIS